MYSGNILKLRTIHNSPIDYYLPLSGEDIHLNPIIGKKLKLEFTGQINCISTGKKIKKSYGQGFSFESFITLPQCDMCIMKPELCHFDQGTCRDEQWGKSNCFIPHVVYLANSSSLKVGITRGTQVPTRWMDQGASFALPLCEVKDRKTSGLIETQIAKTMGDKTNWRKMLKNDVDKIDLVAIKKEVVANFSELFSKHEVRVMEDKLYEFNYPVIEYPQKVKSFNFDKEPVVEGTLKGIKGQYLIFDEGVINMRKYQGYKVNLSYL